MTVIGLASAKGAPGVTTTMLALAAVWPRERELLLVDLDPTGGDAAAYVGVSATPNVVSLAVDARGGLSADVLLRHAQPVVTGRWLVGGASGPEEAQGALELLCQRRLGAALGTVEDDVVVDLGRLGPRSPVVPLLDSLDVLVLVARPTWAQVHHVQSVVRDMPVALSSVQVLLVGDRPYRAGEVSEAIGLPVLGVLADDVVAAGALDGSGVARRLDRTGLLRSARAVAEAFTVGPGAGTSPVGAAAC